MARYVVEWKESHNIWVDVDSEEEACAQANEIYDRVYEFRKSLELHGFSFMPGMKASLKDSTSMG